MSRTLAVLVAIALIALAFFALLSGADPAAEYYAKTSAGLFLVIVLVVVVASLVTTLYMAVFGILADRFARQRFSRFVGWKFLRSQRTGETWWSRLRRSAHAVRARGMQKKLALVGVGLLGCLAALWLDGPATWNTIAAAVSPGFATVLQIVMLALGAAFLLVGLVGLALPTRAKAPHEITRQRSAVTLPTFISIVGVAIGLWALIVVLGVMHGLQSDLRSKILRTNAHLVVEPREPGGVLGDAPALEAAVRQLPGVLEADAYVRGEVMMSSPQGIAVNVVVKGLDEGALARSEQLQDRVIEGSIGGLARPETLVSDLWRFPFTEERPRLRNKNGVPDPLDPPPALFDLPDEVFPGVLIGIELSRQLGAEVGDEIQLVSPDGDVGPTGLRPKLASFRVAGVFRTGMYEYDQKLAYVALDAAQRFFDYGRDRNFLEARVERPETVTDLVPALTETLGASFPGLVHSTFQERNKNLFSALALERIVMFIILGFIIFVASLLIVSSLVMLVVEKVREIAVLKALGASDPMVVRSFVVIGTFIGLFGILAGVPLGIATCVLLIAQGLALPNQFYISTLPVKLDAFEIAIFGLAALGICLLATLYPSKKAAALKPADGLRHG
ncbi:MAG: ABC transporter permease [Deltaproteobacteria bacterium]|nr:ABC transporter permease [Deltaproteobacteria bacterium]